MITMAAPVDRMRAIGLDELVARAPLLTRLDRKYILPLADVPTLLDGLTDDVRVLEIEGQRDFGYQSRYFDTPRLDSYLGAAHRRHRRFKIRIRSYLDTDLRFLEVKTRGRRGMTVKHRVPYTVDGDRLGIDARAHIDAVLTRAGIRGHLPRLVPTLTTHYRRTTLYLPATGSRVTIDSGLTWALPDGTAIQIRDRAIVETKSDQTASEVDRLLWSLRHRPCSVSKYGTGLAALRPDLPANHWRPVLRRHFDVRTQTDFRTQTREN
jgi:hypothetical protein